MKLRIRRFRTYAGVAVVAACLSVSACGSSGNGGSSSGGGSMTLAVGINPGNLQDTFQYVAQEAGFYKKNGLNVSLENIASAATEAQALEAGSLDIGALEISVFLNAPKAADLKLIAGANASDPVLIANPKIKTANADKPFPASLLDLKGKKIGVPVLGTGPQIVLTKMLELAGLQASDVQFVQVGNTSTSLPAMQAGRVDAIYGTASSLRQVAASKANYYVVAKADQFTSINLTRAFFASLGVSSQKVISQKPAAIKAYCTAIVQTINWMKDPANIKQLTTYTEKWMGIDGAATARNQIQGALPTTITKLSQSDWDNAVKVFPNPNNLTFAQANYTC